MNRMCINAMAVAMTAMMIACGKVDNAPKAEVGEAVEISSGAGDRYMIDTTRSSVKWQAAKVTNAHDGGFRQFSGTLTASGEEVTGVDITINTTSIYSDNEKLTGHLKSADFFAVDKHPTATFQANRFEKFDSAGMTHRVTGNLTMLGTTHSVTFPAKIAVTGNEVKANANFIINRKDWNIVYTGAPDDLIRDDVRIIFDVTAVKGGPA